MAPGAHPHIPPGRDMETACRGCPRSSPSPWSDGRRWPWSRRSHLGDRLVGLGQAVCHRRAAGAGDNGGPPAGTSCGRIGAKGGSTAPLAMTTALR